MSARRTKARYEVRAFVRNPRARRGEQRIKTYYYWTDDPHYAAIELYRVRRETRDPRWRFEVVDHGSRGARLGTVVSYEELIRRSRSLVASDRTRRHRDARAVRSKRDPAQPFSVSMTYEVVTPESAEHGDVEDQGYDYEDEAMSLTDVVREVQKHGPYDEIQEMPDHRAGSRGALLRLYESEGSVNYRTGAETRHALHIRGSERAIRRLAQVLESRRVGRDRNRRWRRA